MDKKLTLKKMKHTGEGLLQYELCDLSLNQFIGKPFELEFTGNINCVNCEKKIKKTFGDGYCYPCFQKLAACDLCILKPELCHYRHGTCREPEWGQKNCLIPHVVYLSNTTGLKVGITREHKRFERWGDQGAVAAIVIARVPERYVSGLMEVALKKHLNDKTDWRALIRGQDSQIDMLQEKEKYLYMVPDELRSHILHGGDRDKVYEFQYPVRNYPLKAITVSLDKERSIKGELHGIRGQYLFISERAFNVRKHIGYEVVVRIAEQ